MDFYSINHSLFIRKIYSALRLYDIFHLHIHISIHSKHTQSLLILLFRCLKSLNSYRQFASLLLYQHQNRYYFFLFFGDLNYIRDLMYILFLQKFSVGRKFFLSPTLNIIQPQNLFVVTIFFLCLFCSCNNTTNYSCI